MRNRQNQTIIKRRSKRAKQKRIWIGVSVFLVIAILSVGAVSTVYLIKNQQTKVEASEGVITAYVAKEQIKQGQIITTECMSEVKIEPTMPTDYYLSIDQIGKHASVTIPEGMLLLSNMCYIYEIEEGQREVECEVIGLSSNLSENDYVDVRLLLPNGEDYIILAKKSVHDLISKEDGSLERCFLWMKEDEILYYSAAMVDAYLYQGAYLYTTKYIEPAIQKPSEVNYLPSLATLEMMKENPNLLEEAMKGLKERERKSLENRLTMYLNKNVKELEWKDEELEADAKNEVKTDNAKPESIKSPSEINSNSNQNKDTSQPIESKPENDYFMDNEDKPLSNTDNQEEP